MYGWSSFFVNLISMDEFSTEDLGSIKEEIITSYGGTYDWLMEKCLYLSINEDLRLQLFADMEDIKDIDYHSLLEVLNHIAQFIPNGWEDQVRDMDGNVECKWVDEEGMSTCRVTYFIYDSDANEFTTDVCECVDYTDDWGLEYDEY